MTGWYYISGDNWERQGPVTREEIQQLAASGKLRKDDAVWRPGETAQVAASQVPGLFPTTKHGLPLSPDEPPPFPPGFRGKNTTVPSGNEVADEPPPLPRSPLKTASQSTDSPDMPHAQASRFQPAAPCPTPTESGGRTRGGKPIIVGGAILAILTAAVVLGVMFCHFTPGLPVVDFVVDSKVVVEGRGDAWDIWDHLIFEGEPKIHIGDPAPPELFEAYRQHGEFKYLEGNWRTGKGHFKLPVKYAFDNGRLDDVQIDSCYSDWFNSAVETCEAKFGPHHYVEHPTFTLKNGSLVQNEVFGWRTTAGNWELSKFNPDLSGVSERTGIPIPNYLHVVARLVKPKP